MWNNLKRSIKENRNFIHQRWDNPLHNDYSTNMQSQSWPSGEDFYHALNPMFSYFLQKDEHLKYYKVVLLRDGAQALLDFFLRFPTPEPGFARVIVNKELLFLVPEAWRSSIFCYKLETNRAMKKTDNYLFYGLASDASLSWPTFHPKLERWLSQFNPEGNVFAFFPIRNEIYVTDWREKKIVYELTSHFQLYFNRKISFLSWDDVQALSVKSDLAFVNMDLWHSGVGLCKVDSLMMSRTPQIWSRGTYPEFQGEKIGEWPVSFTHHLSIYAHVECPHDDFTFFSHLDQLANSISPTRIPLPEPIKPMLWDLLSERLEVKGLKRSNPSLPVLAK